MNAGGDEVEDYLGSGGMLDVLDTVVQTAYHVKWGYILDLSLGSYSWIAVIDEDVRYSLLSVL